MHTCSFMASKYVNTYVLTRVAKPTVCQVNEKRLPLITTDEHFSTLGSLTDPVSTASSCICGWLTFLPHNNGGRTCQVSMAR